MSSPAGVAHELSVAEWLTTIESDYLDSFIRQGGSAVKVVVAADDSVDGLVDGLRNAATGRDYLFAEVDETVPRVFMVDRLFLAVSAQIPWNDLARAYTDRLLRSLYGDVGEAHTIAEVATAKGIDESLVRTEVQRRLSDGLLRNYDMTRDFRVAITRMCMAQLVDDPAERGIADMLVEWIRGELTSLVALRKAAIYQKVARHNARQIFGSLPSWIGIVGRPGLVVVVDIRRYHSGRPGPPVNGLPGRPATPAAAMDLHELMRQFIDSTDELENALIVFITGPEFTSDVKRGWGNYEALRLRLADDVHDRNRANPLAPMVRLHR